MAKAKLNLGECYSILAHEEGKPFIDYAEYIGEIEAVAYFRLTNDSKKYAMALPSNHLIERDDGVIKLVPGSHGLFVIDNERALSEHQREGVESLISKLEVQNA